MFDMRNKDDVARDISMLNGICLEWGEYHKMVLACMKQCNIDKIRRCDCMKVEGVDAISKRLNCKECNGTGYKITFKKTK